MPRRRWLTREELELVCEELGPERAAYVLFVVATGARRSELYAARAEDVDWARGLVWLSASSRT